MNKSTVDHALKDAEIIGRLIGLEAYSKDLETEGANIRARLGSIENFLVKTTSFQIRETH